MEVLIILIGISLLILAVAVLILFKMIDTGQLDEGEGAAWRVLMDDDSPAIDQNKCAPTRDNDK